MRLIAILCSLVGGFAGICLWLLSAASQAEVEQRFPAYAKRIFRPGYQVLTRQGGPIRALALLTVTPPAEPFGPITLMRVLAGLFLSSIISAAFAWSMA